MPVYALSEAICFPDPSLARADGLLAVGGDLSPERLLNAYCMGIFPWYSEGEPILWWSPNPRLILIPSRFHMSSSLKKTLRQKRFTVTLDTAFKDVMAACAAVRQDQGEGTWILPDMEKAYYRLHQAGFAHSVEAWQDGELAGGLYGVSLGRGFFGESMFFKKSNASKAAFATLVEFLTAHEFEFIDCQMKTPHLMSLGAEERPRSVFLDMLHQTLEFPTLRGRWSLESENGLKIG
ncbi:leucyl/phenylalanyl-tRNA--protein transferase [Desulfatibacillum alkenivorans DSM 16219]|uniref:Leucyl/phenylalanyl-tRNA--protein transferase n=1 Tax=Desulfatibacillum alkenivorans DSM 16219 TaxID=1121393 RepID=A0A1M6I516_9BACT|nr:leucyl/phenylalanyl-tRNA--protein transferase [Desulfatibacillum alkenivorans]SHJ29528.1 leucyl/phenylalanyl-tRNA--protein transferase [Desulfatibacillum alkenivorans DSM 16219]